MNEEINAAYIESFHRDIPRLSYGVMSDGRQFVSFEGKERAVTIWLDTGTVELHNCSSDEASVQLWKSVSRFYALHHEAFVFTKPA